MKLQVQSYKAKPFGAIKKRVFESSVDKWKGFEMYVTSEIAKPSVGKIVIKKVK